VAILAANTHHGGSAAWRGRAARLWPGTDTLSEGAAAPLVLALDVGTSSVRAYVYDALGRRLRGARLRYAWRTTPDGGVEADADDVVRHTVAALDAVLHDAGPLAEQITAVGVAALWHSLLGVGADGRPATPAYAWSDARAAGAAAALRRRLDADAVHARTGAVLHTSYLPAKLLWLSESRPAEFARSRYWMSVGEYLALRLFGERRVSLSMASGTGLFDQQRLAWDAGVLDALPVTAAQLSPLVDLDAPSVGLRPEFAGRWPTLRSVPWLPAAGDGACANVGAGCTTPDHVALSLGTSGALRVVAAAEASPVPPGLWRYRVDRRRAVTGGAVSNGGNVYAWLRATLRLPEPAELEDALAAMPADGHGLTVIPSLAGERSPDWPVAARATVTGLTLDTTPAQIAHAAFEGVAYRLALIRRLLRRAFPAAQRVVASGGALRRSPTWARIIADAFGEPLLLAVDDEASSRGAALLALEVTGALRDVADAPAALGATVAPDAARHARYVDAIARYEALERRVGASERA